MNSPIIRSLFSSLLVTTCALLLPSLAAARSAELPTSPSQQSGSSSRIILKLGMTGDQVLQLVGRPSVVKSLKNAEVKAEVWLYSYNKLDGVKQVATSMRDVPYVDPLTGILKMIQEPVYSQEMTYVVETTELLVVDGKLSSSKRYRSLKRDFN